MIIEKDCDNGKKIVIKKKKLKKIVIKFHASRKMIVCFSSMVNEGIRAILNLFFFLQEDFTRTKSIKRIQANKKKKSSIFMCIKSI